MRTLNSVIEQRVLHLNVASLNPLATAKSTPAARKIFPNQRLHSVQQKLVLMRNVVNVVLNVITFAVLVAPRKLDTQLVVALDAPVKTAVRVLNTAIPTLAVKAF